MLDLVKAAAERVYEEDMKAEVKDEAIYLIDNSDEDFDEGELDALLDALFSDIEEAIAKFEGTIERKGIEDSANLRE